jgi:hypothetical protein
VRTQESQFESEFPSLGKPQERKQHKPTPKSDAKMKQASYLYAKLVTQLDMVV